MRGGFAGVEGTLTFDPSKPEESAVEATIELRPQSGLFGEAITVQATAKGDAARRSSNGWYRRW